MDLKCNALEAVEIQVLLIFLKLNNNQQALGILDNRLLKVLELDFQKELAEKMKTQILISRLVKSKKKLIVLIKS